MKTLRVLFVLAACTVVMGVLAGGCARKPEGPVNEIAVDLGGGVRLEMVRIAPGEFFMGGTEQNLEKPVHKVKLTREFWLGKYEITQGQWTKIMGTNPSAWQPEGEYCGSNPVERVSWNDCQEFVKKLNAAVAAVAAAQDGGKKRRGTQAPAGPPGEFRMPTEAEWEYACRAGTTTRFHSGERDEDLGDAAWFTGNSSNASHRVGQKKPNAFGLYDMHGNVWEWTQDWNGEYPTNDVTVNPLGPPAGLHRITRGGAWCCSAVLCRSASRSVIVPAVRAPVIGLRVAMTRSGVVK